MNILNGRNYEINICIPREGSHLMKINLKMIQDEEKCGLKELKQTSPCFFNFLLKP